MENNYSSNEEASTGSRQNLIVKIGRLHVDPDVAPELTAAGVTLQSLLARHRAAEWGLMDEDDWEHNDEMLRQNGGVISVYNLGSGQFIYVETGNGITHVSLAPNIHRM